MSNIFDVHNKRHNIKYKYLVKVPQNVKDAIKFDQNNGTTLWKDTIGKEMSHIKDL